MPGLHQPRTHIEHVEAFLADRFGYVPLKWLDAEPPPRQKARYMHLPWRDAAGKQLTIKKQVDALEAGIAQWGATGVFLYSGDSFKPADATLREINRRPQLDSIDIWLAPRAQNLEELPAVLATLTPAQLERATVSHGQERENKFGADKAKWPEAWATHRAEAKALATVVRSCGARSGAELNGAIVQFDDETWGGREAWKAMWDPTDLDVIGVSFFNFFQKDVAEAWVAKVGGILEELFRGIPRGAASCGWSIPLDTDPESPLFAQRAECVQHLQDALRADFFTDHDSWYAVIYGADDEHGVRSYAVDPLLRVVLDATMVKRGEWWGGRPTP